VRISLSTPDATLLAQLADRAGMMISPTAAEAAGVDFGANPVCSGPFRFVERVAQDRIVLEAFPDYWNAGEIHLDRVVYLPIPDGTVRFANLQSGDLDMVERLQATDLAQAQSTAGLKVETAVSLGYDGITFNVGNGSNADNPFGRDGALLRQAFSAALDREALNQVVFNGVAAPGNQSVPPTSQWYVQDFPVEPRDVEKARALLAEAGHADGVELTMQHPNNPEQLQVAQVIQSMVAEAGITVSLNAKEFASMLADQTAGEYQASLVGWSGRVDPDGNLHQFVTTNGGINDSKYANPEVDRLLDSARTINDPAERKSLYAEATAILSQDLPIVYLYHDTWIWALKEGVEGFVPYPDAMIRLQGVTKTE
jgi:peptide/nickel transport system substrate-binding protein